MLMRYTVTYATRFRTSRAPGGWARLWRSPRPA